MALNPKDITNFKCPSEKAQAFIWDDGVPGLGVRATGSTKAFIFQAKLKTGTGTETIRVKIGAVLDYFKTGMKISEQKRELDKVKEQARAYRQAVNKGIDPRLVKIEATKESKEKISEEKRRDHTLAEAWAAYLEENRSRWSARNYTDLIWFAQKGGVAYKRGHRKTVSGPIYSLLAFKLSDLTTATIKEWATREKAARPTVGRNAFGALRACLKWCAESEKFRGLVDPDICSSSIKKKYTAKKNPKKGSLVKEQLPVWFAAVRQINNPVISAYLQAVLLTGARREEMTPLRWADVDFRWKKMTIKDKVDGQRTIPLTPYVAALLAQLPRRNDFVFSSPAAAKGYLQEPRGPHNRALKEAGIDHLSIHDLRRSFSNLSEWVEVPVGVVYQIMGHKPSATAEKHYKDRPIDLLRMWHIKIEAWILKQAGIEQPADEEQKPGLRVVGGQK